MNFRLLAIISVLILTTLASCKKEAQRIGLNLQPDADQMNVIYSDTTTLLAYSVIIDSIKSDEAPANMVGSIVDPVFGSTTASFQAVARLASSAHSFGDNPLLDSLILSLRIYSVYGDSTYEQTFRIYELDEQMFIDSNYYSTTNTAVKQTLLGEYSFVPNLTDSVILGEDTLAPHHRFNLGILTEELGVKLLHATEDQMSSNADFSEFFNGIRFESEVPNQGGALNFVSLEHALSKITIYYHNDEKDSLFYDYPFTSFSARYNNFYHDYTTGTDAGFRAHLIDGDTTLGDVKCYLQAMGGVKTKILFPHYTDWYNDGAIVVNEARLYLEGFEDPELEPPPSLILVRIDADGNFYQLVDLYEGIDFFGGEYDEDNNRYWFRVTTYFQSLLKGNETDLGLEVFVNGGAYNAHSFILNGPFPEEPQLDRRMRLELSYTKMN